MSTALPNDQGYSSFPATIPPYVVAVMVCLLSLFTIVPHHNETPFISLKHSSMVSTFRIILQFSSHLNGLYQKISNRNLLYPLRHLYPRPPTEGNCSLDTILFRHRNVYNCYERHDIHPLSGVLQTFQSRSLL